MHSRLDSEAAMKSLLLTIALIFLTGPALAQEVLNSDQVRARFKDPDLLREQDTRDEIRDQTSDYVLDRDFDGLERMSQRLRSEKSLTPSGDWKLMLFYDAFAAIKFKIEEGRRLSASQMEEFAKDWIKKYPKSPSASAVLTRTLLRRAWIARGNGYIDTVTAKGWNQFRSFVALASQQLESSKSYAAVDPDWYASKLEVMVHESRPIDEIYSMIREALHQEPTYLPTIHSVIRPFLPKWGGSVDQVYAIISEIAQANEGDNRKIMFARAHMDLADNLGGGERINIFGQNRLDWPTFKDAFDVLMSHYPTVWNKSVMAEFACDARDKETVLSLLTQPVTHDRPWSNMRRYGDCVKWAWDLPPRIQSAK